MREYRYKALGQNGETVIGLRPAADTAALATELDSQNLILLESRPAFRLFGQALRLRRRASRRDLRDFTLHMGTSLSAGIPVIQALRDMESALKPGELMEVVTDIREEISSGNTVADSLAKHPHLFPETYLALIEAGESSGNLDWAFNELVDYLEWVGELRAKIRQALTYPAILASATVGLVLLMMLYVIPRFMGMFEDMDVKLPVLTQRVMAAGETFGRIWPLLLLLVIGAVAGIKFLRRHEEGRYRLDWLLLEMPILGGFISKIALSRFAKNFSMLFAAGLDILRVLTLLERVVGNAVLSKEIARARHRIMSGEPMGAAFSQSKYFPPLIRRLISVGEGTGKLDVSLAKAAEFLDKDLPRALKQLFAFLDAAIILILGGLIAISALALLLPIFQLRSNMGQ